MKKIISPKHIALLALGLALGLGATYAMAWTAPTAAPTGGNVAAPVNTSAIPQVKTGNLGTLGALNAVGTITSTNGGIRTINSGLAGSISARNVRATSNSYPGYAGPPAFEIAGEPTGWMAAQQFCLTSNPSSGMPGDAGYNCINSSTGWGGSLPAGNDNFDTLWWDVGTASWVPTNLLRTIPATGVVRVANALPPNSDIHFDVNGRVAIKGGTPAVNKVLTAQDTIGNATWSSLGSQVATVHESSSTLGYGTSRRVHATCPPNHKAIGGGGICQNGGNPSFPAPMNMSLPINTVTDTTDTAGFADNSTAVPGITTTGLNAWMVVCYDENVQHAWVTCVPNN